MHEFLSIAAMLIILAAAGSKDANPTTAKVCTVPLISMTAFGC